MKNLDETLAIVGEKTLINFLASKLINGTTDDVQQLNKPIWWWRVQFLRKFKDDNIYES